MLAAAVNRFIKHFSFCNVVTRILDIQAFCVKPNQKGARNTTSIVLLILLSSTLVYSSASTIDAQPSQLRKSINLSNSTGNSYFPQMVVPSQSENQAYNDSIYIVWSDNTTGNGDIYFKRSMDNGTSFGTIENLSNDVGSSHEPQIVISRNNVYVVWNDNTTGNGDIYFKRSMDNGTSFGSTQNLGTSSGKSRAAQIAAYQDNVYVVWNDDTTGNGDIYFKASLDNGTKFGGRKILAKNNGISLQPQMAVSPNNIIYATWQDNTPYDRSEEDKTTLNVLYRVSKDSGSTFANRSTIGKDVGDLAAFTQIATMPGGPQSGMNNNAYVVWSDILKYRQPGTFEVFFQIITNNGTALSNPINLSNNDGNSIMPNVVVSDNGNVYVAWIDDSTGNGDIYFTR
jgi:hypothetical protein